MPTFTSPVGLGQFQTYLRDTSTDPTLTSFYQSLLDSATEQVYNWLDRDYTANAAKTDVFIGDGTAIHRAHDPVGTLLVWTSTDQNGTITNNGTTRLLIRANGQIVQVRDDVFSPQYEHAITYQQPSSLACPETVKQVITELAAELLDASGQGSGSLGLFSQSTNAGADYDRRRFLDLTERHRQMLAPYKRHAI